MPRFLATGLLIGLMVLATGTVFGQTYPNKPIRIVTASAGGPADFAARLIAQGISGSLTQPVIVDNRGGIIPAETVSKAPPDGYTLLLDGGSFWITPLLQKTPYDVVRDFLPVSMIVTTPSLLIVHPAVPAKSVKELIVLAKAKPGELNYASSVAGSAPHLAAELFKAMAGVNMVLVNYKGTVPALNGLLSGESQVHFSTLQIPIGIVKSGQVRVLAVTSVNPSPLVPDVPTVASMLPGFEWENKRGIFAPAKTPAAVINRLNQEIVRLVHQADVKERFLNAGSETVGSSPEQFATAVKAEIARVGKVIKDNGIRAE